MLAPCSADQGSKPVNDTFSLSSSNHMGKNRNWPEAMEAEPIARSNARARNR